MVNAQRSVARFVYLVLNDVEIVVHMANANAFAISPVTNPNVRRDVEESSSVVTSAEEFVAKRVLHYVPSVPPKQ